MRERLDSMMESYDKANSEWKQRVKSGDATQEDYDGWLKDQATDRAFVQSMAKTLAQDANRTNQLDMDTVNDAIPSVFAENANYAAFEVEHGIGYETHAFDLYDQSTVRRLIRDQPDLLPPLPNPRMDNGRDLRWNRQKFASVITQSVLQGESIPRAADRISRVMRMNEAAATRAARTALTGAENAGRVDSYRRAQSIGIELEQEWLATHDERTRITHRLLDGEHVPVGERFVPDGYGDKYSIGFPGDPTALGEMVYNCRCTLVPWLPSIAEEDNRSWAKMPDGMTYDEWKHGKKQVADSLKSVSATEVEEDIFQRYSDEVGQNLSGQMLRLVEDFRDEDEWDYGYDFDEFFNDIDLFLREDLDSYITSMVEEKWGGTFQMGMDLGGDAYDQFVGSLEGRRDFAVRMGWLKQYDVDSLELLEHYCGTGWYEHVNERLRGGGSAGVADTVDRIVGSMDRLMEASGGLQEPTEFIRYYRNIPDGIASALRGETDSFHELGFMSVTAADSDEHEFAESANVLAHVIVPDGKGTGIYAESFESLLPSHYGMLDDVRPDAEKEFVIKRDSDFEVLKFTPETEEDVAHIWLRLRD